jgi:hypothetical protein
LGRLKQQALVIKETPGELESKLIENKVNEILPTLSGLTYSQIELIAEDILRITKLYPILINHP